jgi:hypothetical protein
LLDQLYGRNLTFFESLSNFHKIHEPRIARQLA